MADTSPVLLAARFDPKLRVYLYLRSLGLLLVTLIGIPVIPVWLFAGWAWSRRYFESLRCELDERRLRVHRGVIFRKSKTIPLDKIQDFSLRHGPVQRALGLCVLRIETAGQSSPQGSADSDLIGLVDAEEFQEQVLAQRDRIAEARPGATQQEPRALPPSDAILVEIRDLLQRMEQHLRVAR